MKRLSVVCISMFALCAVRVSAAEPIISPNGSLYSSVSASSSINGSYPPANLFSHPNPPVGVELQENDPGQTWAGGLGPHSHYVEFALDQAYLVESIYYAQRDYLGQHNSNFDKVVTIDIWAGSSAFAPADPGTSPDATASITHQTDDTFLEYALSNAISGQYFLVHVSNPNYLAPSNGNGVIGGSELRLGGTVVPEPSSIALAGIAALALLYRRRN